MRKHVYLTGMMGSGKTTIGRMLAQRLCCPFVDADERIEQAAGVKIAKIFELEGEAGFRERETRALREIAAGKPCVVATGGGAVLRDENVALMRRTGVVVLLDRSLSDMVRDVSQAERPNLAGDKAERMQALYEARKDRYRETCDIAFDNGGSPLGAARRLAELLRAQDMKRRGGNRMLKDLVIKNRSYRRFDESVRVTEETLRGLVELARLTASGANAQALRYRLVTSPEDCARVFATLGWAAALPDWPGPKAGERPACYIVVLSDLSVGKNRQTDVGIAAQTMLLGATEKGLGGCMLANVRRTELLCALNLSAERFFVELVIALGRPVEDVRLVDLPESGDTRYWRDADGVHYVPKRRLEDLIV